MSTKTMKVGYRLVRNATSTADRAPYLGIAVPVGSFAYENILQRMLDRGTFMTRATAQYFLNALYEFAAERIADDIVRINMGAVSLYPMIGGPFDSEDDTFRVPRNTLYIGATLSQDIRDAVSGVSPASLGTGPESGSVKISSVMDLASETYRLIDGQKRFRIAGIDLTVPDGEDESLALVAEDGLTKVADIAVVSTEDGQRIVCSLASAVPAGSYHVRLVSHGLDPTAPLVTALHRVTVKAPVPTPTGDEPEVTRGYSSGYGDAGMIDPNADFIMEGSNLAGSSVRIDWTDEGGNERTLTVPAGEVSAEDESITLQQGDWLEACTTADGAVLTFTVTTSHGSTTYQATVRA